MNIWERAKLAWATFRRYGGIELPDAGRSSEETLGGAMSTYVSAFSPISPIISFEMLRTLKYLWLFNPDVSQYVANIVNLGNPGHTLTIDAKSDSIAEAAVKRLNEAASRIYTGGAGVDGLFNQYLANIAWSGAISSEDVPNFGMGGGRVEKVVLVPVEQIRFTYDKATDTYLPHQQSNNLMRCQAAGTRTPLGLIPLNQETYQYFALSTVENSPYARPPGTAAVQSILESQKPLMENIRYMAQKFGLMGLVTAAITPPPRKSGESEAEYQGRAKTLLQMVAKVLEANFNKGLLVTFRDQKIEHTNIAEGATGVYDVNRINEEQVFSGLAAMPGFHGRTDSTTETFADVVYYLLTAQTGNMQRLVKRRHERTCRLDMRLGGLEIGGVSLNFNKAHSRNAKAEAETDETLFRTIKDQVKSGLLSPDEGAQKMGRESWFDVELLFGDADGAFAAGLESQSRRLSDRKIITLSFDKRSQKYIFQPQPILLSSGEDADSATGNNVVDFKKKKAQ